MANDNGEVVLVTGGSGFIGQHIIKMLLKNKSELNIREIRSIDLKAFKNTIDDDEVDIRTFVGDLCEKESVEDAFRDVNTVFHCAGLMGIQYPPQYKEMDRANVETSRVVVELCVKYNIQRLIYTSCASVCMIPYKGTSTSIIINQTESKAPTPKYDAMKPDEFDKQFFLRGYSSSKLRAEQIILGANGTLLNNQTDCLATTAMRPPLVYGEGDNHFVPNALRYLSKNSYVYPRFAGKGGKQQFCYVGNVAWGHLCAYKTLKSSPKSIAGLPVFITDETSLCDISRFLQKVGNATGKFKIQRSTWYTPRFLFHFFAVLWELLVSVLAPVKKITLQFSPYSISTFSSSIIYLNRLRASIHMDYEPLIDDEISIKNSAKWYGTWWEENISTAKAKMKHN